MKIKIDGDYKDRRYMRWLANHLQKEHPNTLGKVSILLRRRKK